MHFTDFTPMFPRTAVIIQTHFKIRPKSKLTCLTVPQIQRQHFFFTVSQARLLTKLLSFASSWSYRKPIFFSIPCSEAEVCGSLLSLVVSGVSLSGPKNEGAMRLPPALSSLTLWIMETPPQRWQRHDKEIACILSHYLNGIGLERCRHLFKKKLGFRG